MLSNCEGNFSGIDLLRYYRVQNLDDEIIKCNSDHYKNKPF